MKRWILFCMLGLFATLSFAQTGIRLPAQTIWRVASTNCALGCSAQMRSFLKQYLGQSVELSAERLSAPFLDSCEGRVRVELIQQNVASLLNELNQSHGKKKKFSAKELHITTPEVISGTIFCIMNGQSFPIVRLPVVAEKRILILFEEQSLIELN